MRVEWRPLADADLEEIVRYIAFDNPEAAYEIHDRIREHSASLSLHPRIGRPGRVRGTRELVVPATSFIVAYRVTGAAVTILRVLHGARKWRDQF